MTEKYAALISGFVGALIGGAASVAVVWIQAHFQNKNKKATDCYSDGLRRLQTYL